MGSCSSKNKYIPCESNNSYHQLNGIANNIEKINDMMSSPTSFKAKVFQIIVNDYISKYMLNNDINDICKIIIPILQSMISATIYHRKIPSFIEEKILLMAKLNKKIQNNVTLDYDYVNQLLVGILIMS